MRIVIIGNFGGANAGDNVILESVIHDIHKYIDNCDIILPGNKEYLLNHSCSEEMIISTSKSDLALRFFSLPMIKVLKQSDYVIFTAGTLFARRLLDPRYNIVSTFMPSYLIARIANPKLKLAGYNVGVYFDGRKLSNRVLRKIVNCFDIITCRHSMNVELDRTTAICSLDNVFGYYPPEITTNTKDIIGINISSYTVVHADDYENIVINSTKRIIRDSNNTRIIAIETTNADYEYTNNLFVRNQIDIEVINITNLSYKEIVDLFSRFICFWGMRMHSLIFCCKTSVPFIAVNYDNKVRTLMRELEMDDMCLDINEVLPDATSEKLSYLISYKNILTNKIYEKSLEAYKKVTKCNEMFWNEIKNKYDRI